MQQPTNFTNPFNTQQQLNNNTSINAPNVTENNINNTNNINNSTTTEKTLQTSFPINLKQKPVSEILSIINKNLSSDLKNFQSLANNLYTIDERLFVTRANYLTLVEHLEKETEKLNDLDTNVSYIESINTNNNSNDEKIDNTNEIEKLSDEFRNTVEGLKDESVEINSLMNECVKLMGEIDDIIDEKRNIMNY